MKERDFSDSLEELEFVYESLEREKREEESIFSKDWLSGPLQDRIQLGITIYPLVYEEQSLGRDGSWNVTFRLSNPKEIPPKFQSGVPVQIGKEKERIKGVLISVHPETVRIALEEVPEWCEEGKCQFDLLPDETSYQEMFRVLETVKEAKKGTRLFHLRETLLGYKRPDPIPERASDISRVSQRIGGTLNESQKKAVLASVFCEDVTVIHGPPGTGKTTTLTEIIYQLVKEEKQILVSAPTHAACDLLVESVSSRGIPTLRLGHPARISETVLHSTLDYKLFHHPDGKLLNEYRKQAVELNRQARKYKRNFGAAEREERKNLHQEVKELKKTIRTLESGLIDRIVSSHPVIVATPLASAKSLLNGKNFDVCVLDEGSQGLEPAFWIPISKADRVILAGDHKQLPPTLFSEKNGLETTLFEKAAIRLRDSGHVFLLDTQYRMKDEIAEFSAREFYEGKLISGRTDSEKQTSFPEGFPFTGSFQWIDTSGTDTEEVSVEESLANPFEADLQIVLCGLLIGSGWKEEEITILSPYRAQVRLLEERLRQAGFPNVSVSTIDSFQGRENRCIILGFVRSNSEGKSGFLKESRRINVAMTRARDLLLCIGDGSTLSEDVFLSRLIRFAEETDRFRTAWEFL
ncbi:AAA family ATPase [Leptospira gomenensis]|uniref:AAA family ATPase n=1 Tax=Leptospira gomenensis TaxID=2484974 RepID=A0A5F1YBR2_9LEPT|nr:AAA domain-containing protein [Leptospira gomenensis]TGK33705.1 AAA family ATPase [Leptospira gomenensis]TGK35134.1 AAA family ATPase [Leptospira gomenensis]TGK46360.1 AAA family ATPase [Leptospira gomenensis]TGK61225.1 AAA family ATPase [Leptospira gomenensis]